MQIDTCGDENGAPEQRINACTWLIEFAPQVSDQDRGRFYAQRGNAYTLMAEYDLAIDDYDHAIEAKPDDVIAIGNRAAAYRYIGQHDLAILDYERAIRLDPDNPLHFFNRAGTYSEEGRYDRAIEDYTRTIELNPDLPPVYMDRANAFVETEQYDRAILDYSAAIRLVPDYADAYANRGNALTNTHQFARAIADYDQAIRLEPDNDFIYVNRAYAYFDDGQYEKAKASLTDALKLDPDNIRAQAGLAWLYAAAKDPAFRNGGEALRLARAVVAAQRSTDYLKTLGAAYVEVGNIESALTAYKNAMQLGGRDVVVTYQAYLSDKKFYKGERTGTLDFPTEAALRACVRAGCKMFAD